MKELDVFLDTQENALLFQYPLSLEVPNVQTVNTKCDDKYVQISTSEPTGTVNYKGISGDTINKYYILNIKESEVVGLQVKSITQLRPFLPETEETIKLSEKKETKVFALNESQDELENRMKNPNYIVEKVNKTPWVEYKLTEYKESQVVQEPSRPISTQIANIPLEKIKETIYNARVVNIPELKNIYPTSPISDINQAVSEMTIPFLGRYILKIEYFNDLSTLLISILKRIEEGNGVFTFTKDELIDQSEEFTYLLNQIAYKQDHVYVLKGYNENTM
ncbi:uncharacterized protein NEPG_00867 [Nematocida parisii ERTm1]|uniref:uncharacterized protein n=1 Tax=Nematocida parisii (strain ERTm1 / ATCC PRA-289) TaxID=881290 RepID=UPI000264BB1A|nr:uncharacterized protein NEPG_00867 [Nematocida parisii ERTm1]EIJ94200.1 hypothetical protein NEPG_00867 [Nematocida parisii ERTm1]|eukprot:XP_013058696.1 hypothetical protein NEPG_00867 [Nematocida parisii ERTm1]